MNDDADVCTDGISPPSIAGAGPEQRNQSRLARVEFSEAERAHFAGSEHLATAMVRLIASLPEADRVHLAELASKGCRIALEFHPLPAPFYALSVIGLSGRDRIEVLQLPLSIGDAALH